jgi:hypothetical protein
MKQRKTGRGQPRKGPDGARVSAYPALLVRIPATTKRQLEALSSLQRTPMWALVDQAARELIERLPEADRVRLARARPRRRPLRQFGAE